MVGPHFMFVPCHQGFSIPGTVSSEFKKTDLHTWREGFFKRLKAHAERAAATAALSERGKEEGAEPAESAACGYPKIVAFAGKRQVGFTTNK